MAKKTKVTPEKCIKSLMRFLKTGRVLFIVTSKLNVIYSITTTLTKKVKNKENHRVKLVSKKTKPIYFKISLVIIYETNDETGMDVFEFEDEENKILVIPTTKTLADEILCQK